MRVGLICFDSIFPGTKMLSAYLRQQGFSTSVVFLIPDKVYDAEYRFSPEIKNR